MDGEELERFLEAIASDWRTAQLGELDRGLCAYAEKLTRQPATMAAGDVERARTCDELATTKMRHASRLSTWVQNVPFRRR